MPSRVKRQRKRVVKRGGARRVRCHSCQRLGYASVARRNAGVCHMCGGSFFSTLLGLLPKAINAIGSWRYPNNYPGVTDFPAAVSYRSRRPRY